MLYYIMDLASNVYQTTYKKNDGQGVIYIALASLAALVILFAAVYFMFFNTGEQQIKNNVASTGLDQSDSNVSNEIEQNVAQYTPTPSQASATQPSNTPTPTQTEDKDNKDVENEDINQDQDTTTYDTSYVYGHFQQDSYVISDDKSRILDGSKTIYTAPSGYEIISFYVNGNAIFVVFKTPEAYTYEFRKVYKGTSSLGGLFYKYYSSYDMTSFVVDPVNYKTKTTYIIFTSKIKKQFLVLKVEDFKEVGKKVISAPGFNAFKSAYKLANEDAVLVKYTTATGDNQEVLINFSESE